MNNLDIFILIVIAISALIALNRGLIKEVLSIIGWMLSIVVIIFMLPIVQPFMQQYTGSEMTAVAVSSILIFIIFFIVWIIITSQIIDKIRSSKLSSLDRILGLFFGVIRACILIILFYILAGWIVPKEEQPDMFKESKYFNMAGDFAEPIEKLLPKEILTEPLQSKKSDKPEDSKKHADENLDNLFDKLVQPKVDGKKTKDSSTPKSAEGYNKTEQDSMDRLIDMAVE